MINLVIWNEFLHEKENDQVKSIYPKGIHECIKEFLSKDKDCLLYTSPSPRDATLSRMPSSA